MTIPAPSPMFSVVTPFHDTAEHLRECIESVLAQTAADFEYVLQDNASTDGSTEIALEFSRRDPRIRYIRTDSFLTQLDNYNLALTRIHPASRYTKVVQADDWIAPDCLSSMARAAEASPRIGLVASYRLRGESLCGDGLPYTTTVLTGRDAARLHLLSPAFLFGSPTTVLYRSEIVRQRRPFYAPGRLNDDTEACYEILSDWDFGFVHQVLSYTRIDKDSMYGRTADMDPGILDRLITLRRYGPRFLTTAEFRTRLNEIETRYYRRLAWAALCGRGHDYWDFHRRGLATQGPGLDRLELAKALAHETLSLLAAPARIREVARERRRRNRP